MGHQDSMIMGTNGVFPKWNENSVNSGNLINPVCYLCLAGAVTASLSLTQEVGDTNNLFKYIFCVIETCEFSEKI